jgi:hypothetical protein
MKYQGYQKELKRRMYFHSITTKWTIKIWIAQILHHIKLYIFSIYLFSYHHYWWWKLNYQSPKILCFTHQNDNKSLNHQHLSNQCVFIKFKVTVSLQLSVLNSCYYCFLFLALFSKVIALFSWLLQFFDFDFQISSWLNARSSPWV